MTERSDHLESECRKLRLIVIHLIEALDVPEHRKRGLLAFVDGLQLIDEAHVPDAILSILSGSLDAELRKSP